jgi:alpha-tubulin suppressor-like RCC1 family protein
MVLISDGTILSWGNNIDGQLAIPRCYLDGTSAQYDLPQNINYLNKEAVDLNGNPLSFGNVYSLF